MDLTIDIGNSLTKLALFKDDEICWQTAREELNITDVQAIFNEYSRINRTIISSVKVFDTDISDYLKQKGSLLILSHLTNLPFKNLYETPDSLGRDRIAAVAGATSLFQGDNVLVIDAGTCITYDLLTNQNEYLGGAISPGINMRFKALNTFTGKLPLIEPETSLQPDLIGKSTAGSILSGVQMATMLEVDATIDEYKKRFAPLKTVVTGGDLFYFDKYLKNNIFAAPNLVLVGLKKILDFNEGS